ncbi:putative HNHc nuclease [Lactiplantibacillus argentoratensis]|uniref:putative HNHc nuclease n=1 Tax=Lactiplantibacillus argentoratensis TaxID=271881 RepID=UPI00254C39BA|nr:putative HNHc nuclease [Lactiplantibacillus argentoratensis]MDK9681625.1 putative HNHc nuclease [Lactiplantibacillus argentoratensis]
MELLPTKLIEKDGEWYQVQKLTHKPNLDHVETVSGSADEYYTYSELADTRKARPQQRRLFFALLSDIYTWSGMPTDFLKNLFYLQYESYTFGKQISLSDTTESSVSDANQLLDLVIDFMFEWHVPFKEGYKLLPREQEYYLFQCCRHRVCMICGNRADIHHVDVIGAGLNRTRVDHTKRHVMALCRVHHSEIEQIGSVAFSAKYHVPVDGIKLDKETLKRIGLKGKYSSD